MTKIKFLLTILVCVAFQNINAQRKAVFIILDGIPADVLEKSNTPVLDEIAQTGRYTHAYIGGEKGGYSESPTISAVGYNHLLTGTWSNKHNVWDNEIEAPNYNYWNIFRIVENANADLKTAVFSSWTDNRTKLIGENLNEAGGIKLDYAYDGLELDTIKFPHTADRKFMFNIDEHVSKEAGRYILENGPDLSWVYLEFTDDMGHMYGDSPQLTDAVVKADAQVGRIWAAIKEREQQYGEKWMIVVTTDHGRNAKTGKDHGGQSPRERLIWMTTNQKQVNARFEETPAMVDIMPSILRFMKIEIPTSVNQELDGVPFIGKVSISNLKTQKNGDKIKVTWKTLDTTGEVELFLSSTNEFKNGKTDEYKPVGKAAVHDQQFTFSLPDPDKDFYKLLVKAPDNTLNTWIVPKDYIRNVKYFGRK